MFVYNVKVNGSKLGKWFLRILFIIAIVATIIVCFRILGNRVFYSKEAIKESNVIEINASNYTNVLKAVHDNLEQYLGKKIRFTGYVYRMIDFNDTQFVLARDMVISSDGQTVVVGFLCDSNEAHNFQDGCWVEVEGTIKKGDYHGVMPVIEIFSLKQTEKPSDECVYPPDDSFVATSTII